MMGVGLTGLLLPVRMGLEQMSTDTIGLVLSMYAIGLLLGGLYSRILIIRAGHIRLFAAIAALASISILACSLYANAWLWGGMRILMGFCVACALAVIDSWLSETATQATRGRILAANQIVSMSAIFIGQFLINLSSPSGTALFIMAGMLFSLALIPIVMSRKKGPSVNEVTSMSMASIFRISPLGVVACFFCGIFYSGLLNMLPIFAGGHGIEGFELSLFMGAAVFGALILQFPVGYLSDRFDRRTVLFGLVAINLVATIAAPSLMALDSRWPVMALVAWITGVFACMYPISISETFDKVLQTDMVAAMGGLIAIYALGSILGPYIASLSMNLVGNDGLFYFLAVLELLLLLFVFYRMNVREALPVEDQEKFVIHGAGGASSLELDPRFKFQEHEEPLSPEVESVVRLAEENPATAVKMAIALAEYSPEQTGVLAAALSQVEQVDIAKLYAAITKSAPEMQIYIAETLAAASPEQTVELVDWLAQERPDQLSEIVVAIAGAVPEIGVDIISSAAESIAEDAPEEIIDIAASYVGQLQENLEDLRPIDRAAAQAEHQAADLYNRIAEVIPEQAADLAYTMTEAIPDAATEVTEAYVHTLIEEVEEIDNNFDDEMIGTEPAKSWGRSGVDASETESVSQALTGFIDQVSMSMPKQAVAIATVLIESCPTLASVVIERLQSDEEISQYLWSSLEDKPQKDLFADYPFEDNHANQ